MRRQANCARGKRNKVWKQAENRNPHDSMIKKILSKAPEIGIKQVMNAHVYKFKGDSRVEGR